MDSIQEIRKELQMSQAQLAQWLGITRSALSMAELDHRSLPTHVYVKMNELLQCLQEMERSPSSAKRRAKHTGKQPELKPKLLKLAAQQRLQAQHEQLRLDELQEKRKRPVKALDLVQRLREKGGINLKPGEKVILDMMEANAIALLAKQSASHLELLQLRITNLHTAADNAERHAAKLEADDD